MGDLSVGGKLGASIVDAGGALFSASAEQSAANAQKRIARMNAEISEGNAASTMAAGESEAERFGMKAKADAGAIKTHQAASGVDINSGSAVDVQDSHRALSMFDTMTIKSNAAREAYGFKVKALDFRNEAAMAKARANSAMIAGVFNATSSLLSGASAASSGYEKWQQMGGADATEALSSGGGFDPSAILAF